MHGDGLGMCVTGIFRGVKGGDDQSFIFKEDSFEIECQKLLLSKLFAFSLIGQEASQELVSPYSWRNFHSGELYWCDNFIMVTYRVMNLKFIILLHRGRIVSVPLLRLLTRIST